MAAQTFEQTLRKAERKTDDGDFESLTVRKAQNGYTVSVYRRPKATKDDDDSCCSPCIDANKDLVFNSLDDLKDYVEDVLN